MTTIGGTGGVPRCRCGTRLARDNTAGLCAKCTATARDQFTAAPEVPAEFWDHDHVRRALATRHMGKVIRAYRTHPWHGKAIRQSTVGTWLHLHTSQLSRVENATDTTDLRTMTHWARALHLPDHLLWFQPHDTPAAFHSALIGEPTLAETTVPRGPLSPTELAHSSPPPPTPTTRGGLADRVRASQEQWLHTRAAPAARGRELSELAAWLYPKDMRGPGGNVLVGPGWLLDEPVPLEDVRLELVADAAPVPPLSVSLDHVLPLTARGERYASYSRAVRDLVRPRLLENRVSYRLLGVSTGGGLGLRFGTTTFFEIFDAKEYLAHELKRAFLDSRGSVPSMADLPIRASITDPLDPTRWLMSPGISTLTIRRDLRGGHRFTLHQRDPAAVADGGGMCTVMPAGEFQPSTTAPVNLVNDFSLWRNIMREYSEEFLGNPEHDGASPHTIDYTHDHPFADFETARAQGTFRLWHYGLVMDALTLGASQRTVAVIDHHTYDRLFHTLVRTNDEGHLIGEGGRIDIPFTADAIDRLEPRLSTGSLALLRLAWRDRNTLLN